MSEEHPEYIHTFTKDELRVKQLIQRELILRLSENPSDNESKVKWIEEYGTDFSVVFNTRMQREPDFIAMCISDKEQVISELIEEVRNLHESRLKPAA